MPPPWPPRRPDRYPAPLPSEGIEKHTPSSGCSGPEPSRSGAESGAFAVDDPEYMANVLWTQALGVMHLARIRVGVRQLSPDAPELFRVAPEQVVRVCVSSAKAIVGAPAAASGGS